MITLYPLEIGKAKLEKIEDYWKLSVDGEQWFVINQKNNLSVQEFWLELFLAKGKVVTTGLGLGTLQQLLIEKESVSEVIVYEKNQDVIDLFKELINRNEIIKHIDKLKIINGDAEELKGEKCDCLFLDHYELESIEYIANSVKKITRNNNSKVSWFWPGGGMYRYWVNINRAKPDVNSFEFFKMFIQISNGPSLSNTEIANLYGSWVHSDFESKHELITSPKTKA